MAKVIVEREVDVAVGDLFATWHDEYADIYKYNPGVKHSKLLEDSPAEKGVGALRQCDFSDGKNWVRERIMEVTENKRLVIDIYDGSVPLKSAVATLDFTELQQNRSRVKMTMDFEPKFGLLGKLMAPLMKKQFCGALLELLEGNASYATNGGLKNAAAV